jgi:hypothetical protein
MITENNYLKGIDLNNRLKYNVNYCRQELFVIVCAGLASKLLNYEYASELTEA